MFESSHIAHPHPAGCTQDEQARIELEAYHAFSDFYSEHRDHDEFATCIDHPPSETVRAGSSAPYVTAHYVACCGGCMAVQLGHDVEWWKGYTSGYPDRRKAIADRLEARRGNTRHAGAGGS